MDSGRSSKMHHRTNGVLAASSFALIGADPGDPGCSSTDTEQPNVPNTRGTQRQFSENICSEGDLRSRIFGTFVVKFLACLPLLGFSNI